MNMNFIGVGAQVLTMRWLQGPLQREAGAALCGTQLVPASPVDPLQGMAEPLSQDRGTSYLRKGSKTTTQVEEEETKSEKQQRQHRG